MAGRRKHRWRATFVFTATSGFTKLWTTARRRKCIGGAATADKKFGREKFRASAQVTGITHQHPIRQLASAAARDLWKGSRGPLVKEHILLLVTQKLSNDWGPPQSETTSCGASAFTDSSSNLERSQLLFWSSFLFGLTLFLSSLT